MNTGEGMEKRGNIKTEREANCKRLLTIEKLRDAGREEGVGVALNG